MSSDLRFNTLYLKIMYICRSRSTIFQIHVSPRILGATPPYFTKRTPLRLCLHKTTFPHGFRFGIEVIIRYDSSTNVQHVGNTIVQSWGGCEGAHRPRSRILPTRWRLMVLEGVFISFHVRLSCQQRADSEELNSFRVCVEVNCQSVFADRRAAGAIIPQVTQNAETESRSRMFLWILRVYRYSSSNKSALLPACWVDGDSGAGNCGEEFYAGYGRNDKC